MKEKIGWSKADDKPWESFDEDMDIIIESTLVGDVEKKISTQSFMVWEREIWTKARTTF